jgi:YVTN family beta-propeller protein
MQPRRAAALVLIATAACATARLGETSGASLGPLGAAGEVHVLLLPRPPALDRLSYTVEAVSLRRKDGGEVPLELRARIVAGPDGQSQRALATGRVPPGEYAGLSVKVASASLAAEGEGARLLVELEPARPDVDLRLAPGATAVVWLALDPAAVRSGFAFAPAFHATRAPQTAPQAALYVSDARGAAVTVADRRGRAVTGVVPVGAGPKGIALDRFARRAYVALSGEDEIDVLDVAANASLGRVRLLPGDGPTDLALAADGTVVVVNARSRTVAFVDPVSLAELGRAAIGLEPTGLLVDRNGRRAYVANRGSQTVSVIDIPNRAVVATLPTDPEPLRMALSADGARLHVVHRGSAHLVSFSTATFASVARAYVGLGAWSVKVDPRTDQIYVSRSDQPRISVYDPLALQPIDAFDVPGRVFQMSIDDAENAMLVVIPERGVVGVVDLVSRRVLAEIPAGNDPYGLAFAGERL